MADDQLGALEGKIEELLASHARLRALNRKLEADRQQVLDRNAELRQRLERIIDRLKKVELEAET